MSVHFVKFTKTIIALTQTYLQRTNRLPFIKEIFSPLLSKQLKLSKISFECNKAQYFKNKNTDLQFTVTKRFCEKPRQYITV